MNDSLAVTVIIPAYNAESKIGVALESVARLAEQALRFEVIIVDDCSTDSTRAVVRDYVADREGWRLIPLHSNSGSPSRPRNVGIDNARGEFVYFHDADDILLPEGVAALVDVARRHDADVVRGWLKVDTGSGELVDANRLQEAESDADKASLVRRIVAGQSTTCPSLVRTALLHRGGVRWAEDVRLGEDTLFLAELLQHADIVRYVDQPTFIYNRSAQEIRSSTQTYTDSALRDHLHVWKSVQTILASTGVDYMTERGTVAVREALLSLYARREGEISNDAFRELQDLVRRYDAVLRSDGYKPRLKGLYQTVRDGDYEDFRSEIKPRLLIAGYDLKFILPAIPALSRLFEVAVDEWTGHETHDPRKSERLLAWADVVLCEWLLGNAAWFARSVRRDQALIVRCHRFELGRDFGFDPAIERVDRFYGVSVNTLEQFIGTFSIPRSKARLLPNWVDVDSYAIYPFDEKALKLGLVGSVPALKGFRRALEVLALLRRGGGDYTLDVFGRAAHELSWVIDQPDERRYFEECERFIELNGLSEFVRYRGWVDTSQVIGECGWILSMSDLESFHLAPVEGLAAGSCVAVLDWAGARYVYPPEMVFEDVEQIADHIQKSVGRERYERQARAGREFVRQRYGIERFVESVADDVARLLIARSIA